MTKTAHQRLALLVLASVLGSGTTARAQETPATTEARLHFDRAVALFESGDTRGALAEFQRVYDLTARSSVLYNIGVTYQALHDYPRAIEALRRYLASTEGRATPQRDLTVRALAQMETLVAHLQIVRSPPEATVLLDGRALTDDHVTVGPGAHVVSATAPGRQPQQIEVTVVSGDDRVVPISLNPLTTAAIPAPPMATVIAPRPRADAHPTLPDRRWFWSMVVTGGALAIGASITGVVAIAAQRDYATHRVGDADVLSLASRGRTLSLTADLLGLGALAAGTAALVLGLRAGAHPAAQVFVAPTANGATLTAFGTF